MELMSMFKDQISPLTTLHLYLLHPWKIDSVVVESGGYDYKIEIEFV